MRKFVELTAISLRSEAEAQNSQRAVAEPNLDDLERPVAPAEPTPAPGVRTFPITIFADQVRNFHPRQGTRTPGTRVVYLNGAAEIVKEPYDVVKAKFA